MKRSLFIAIILFFTLFIKAQSPFSFIVNASGSGAISCNRPFATYWTVNSFSTPVTYSWVGASTTYTGDIVYITVPGTYTVTGTTSTSLTYSTTVTVQNNTTVPTSSLSPVTQTMNCLSGAMSVSVATNATGGSQMFLSPLGGTFVTYSALGIYTPMIPGTYTHVTVGANGCVTQKTFAVAPAPGMPTFSLTSPQNFSLGCGTKSVATVSITQAAGMPSSNPLSFTVTPTLNYTTGPASTFTLAAPGTYTAVVRDNTTGCDSKVMFSVTLNTLVPAPVVITPNSSSTLTCDQQMVKFEAAQPAPGNFTYSWLRPGQAAHPYDTLTVFSTVAPTATINGTYTFVTTDPSSLCNTTQTISVYKNKFPPIAKIQSMSGSTALTCANHSIVLTNVSTSSIPNSTFPTPLPVIGLQWMGPAPQLLAGASSSYTANVAGVYTLIAQDLNNGCKSSTTAVITDNGAYPYIAPMPVIDLCNQPDIMIMLTNPGQGSYTFMWQAPAGAVITNPNSQSVTVNAAGVYTVLITDVTTSCTAKGEYTVGICVGLDKTQAASGGLSVYPNPVKNRLTVDAAYNEVITLYDAMGRQVMTAEVAKGKNEFVLERLPQGVYFLRTTQSKSAIKLVKIE